ncbi:hemin ABC transporter substrate-binding protein [Phyllobacterium salinisoli]|uniref:Hemin ABC transporter substrate-binding protein n=1 Tax=Phyllobacterium salinisoli TaxID=1899321 RepID=A0A368K5S7_9HYPH|nr:hemin ABC transporter substrate-binding protein [Phyllobacterium salinisoli]
MAGISMRAGRAALLFSMLAMAVSSATTTSALAEETTRIEDSSRLISIGGSLTEIVYALGEEKRLVARDSTSLYPPEAGKLPDVGYMRALSPEGVLSVNPSGILLLEGSGPREALDVLKKASVPMVVVPERFTGQGVLDKIHGVGKALGIQDKADKLAASVGADLAAAEKAASSVKERKRILFILSMQGDRIMASGKNTAANGIIELAGGVNAIDGYEGYKQLTDEAIGKAAPDVILMMDRGGNHAVSPEQIFGNPAFAGTPVARTKKLVRMDALYLLGFGPRTAKAAHDLSVALYGDAAEH